MLRSSNEEVTEQLKAMEEEKIRAEGLAQDMKERLDQMQVTQKTDQERID